MHPVYKKAFIRRACSKPIVSYFIKYFVDPDLFLYTACKLYMNDTVELFLNRGVDVNHVYPDGMTLLHVACTINNYELVELLLDRGADMDLRRDDGLTALGIVAAYDHLESEELLFGYGGDMDFRSASFEASAF